MISCTGLVSKRVKLVDRLHESEHFLAPPALLTIRKSSNCTVDCLHERESLMVWMTSPTSKKTLNSMIERLHEDQHFSIPPIFSTSYKSFNCMYVYIYIICQYSLALLPSQINSVFSFNFADKVQSSPVNVTCQSQSVVSKNMSIFLRSSSISIQWQLSS